MFWEATAFFGIFGQFPVAKSVPGPYDHSLQRNRMEKLVFRKNRCYCTFWPNLALHSQLGYTPPDRAPVGRRHTYRAI